MGTRYLYKEDNGDLIHGHPQPNPPFTVQYHSAHSQHRNDPHAHITHESFDPNKVEWSQRNWGLTPAQKAALIAEAHSCHQDGTYGMYRTAVKRAGQTSTLLEKAKETKVETYETESFDDEGEETSSSDVSLEQRVSDIEDLALTLAGPMEDRIVKLEKSVGLAVTREILDARDRKTADSLLEVHTKIDRLPKFDASPLVERIDRLEKAAVKQVEFTIKRPDMPSIVTVSKNHKNFEFLVELVTGLDPKDRNIWLTGPAGSGKTTAGEKLAEVLGMTFRFSGAIDSPYKLSGYRSATGTYLDTSFRHQYEHGGIWLGDEIDGSAPGALLEINAALANGSAEFPDGMVKRHPDFIALCAANTWGLGGDANYVGRAKLDAAFLDRFVTVEWDYDEDLELEVAGTPRQWVLCVQAVRKAVFEAGAQMVISPRASIKGCQLLRSGMSPDKVVRAVFGRYKNHTMWSQVGKAAEEYKRNGISVQPTRTDEEKRATFSQAYGGSPSRPTPVKPSLANMNFSGVR